MSEKVKDGSSAPETAETLTQPQALAPAGTALPAVIEHRPSRVGRIGKALIIALVVLGGVGFAWWQAHRAPAVPAYIVYGNGRLEADPIDIATKFAGRIAELRADEGDRVTAGQVVAVMDTRDLGQMLQRGEAQIEQARKAVEEARANLAQLQSQSLLAEQEMARTDKLVKNGWATRELFDQRRQQLDAAHSAQAAGEQHVTETEKALSAATHDAEVTRVNIADNTLVAPRDGRIEYRLANVGEVLPAGGKVFTMLDTAYVYMDVYLPTLQADKVKIGAQARILLDAFPERPIPAKVSFLADQAQFTPKMVETRNDRDKLMFRVRVKIDADRAKAHADAVRSGLPGMAYVMTEEKQGWTPALQGPSE